MMKRVVIDTNVYISFMNSGTYEQAVLGSGVVRYMSRVVLMELEAGATTNPARRAVHGLARAFGNTNRLVSPSNAAWDRAGRLLRELRASGREIRRASLINDALIALTARDLGATVVTNDTSDFAAIREHVAFSFESVVGS
jgi:predicted nucleic acid-binding protein